MLMLAAQPEPLRLITTESPPTSGPGEFWLIVGVCLLVFVVSSLGAVYLLWRRSLDGDPSDFAFRAMARRLGVSRHERRLLREIARERSIPPAALLTSPAALAETLQEARRAHGGDERKLIDRIARRLLTA